MAMSTAEVPRTLERLYMQSLANIECYSVDPVTELLRSIMRLLTWIQLATFATSSRANMKSLDSIQVAIDKFWNVMENEAFVIESEEQLRSNETFVWYNEQTKESISTDKAERVHSSGAKLWFLPIVRNDTGLYTTLIKAGTSVMWSHRLKVQVHEFSTGICFKPQTVYGSFKVRTETGHVKCGIAERYNVKGKITWYKDCHSIQGPKYFMIHRELAIIGVNQQDAGYYTCQFTHEHNGTLYNVTQTKMMTVKAPSATLFPVIASPRNGTIEVVLGSSLNITCSAFLGYGKQIFDFLWWEVNGVRVGKENSSRFVIRTERSTFNESYTSAVLTISEVRKDDLLSNFVCTALNSLGWEESIVRLTEKATDIRKYLCTSFFILVNMIILIVVVCKFYRVDAVLLYRDVVQPMRSTDDGKIYDAYVIFARKYHIYDDKNDPVQYFVYNILLDVLEKKCGFTLYVHGRNLLPGEDMSTAADWAISKSRRLILILSSELVEAEEIAIEQQFGLYSALVSSDLKVIVIEMEKIGDESKLQESLRHIIKKKGTIKWQSCKASDKKSLKSRFWKQVRYEMPGRKSPPSNTNALKDKPMDLAE